MGCLNDEASEWMINKVLLFYMSRLTFTDGSHFED